MTAAYQNNMNVEIADWVELPDGFFGEGQARPWRMAAVEQIEGKYLVCRYVDRTEFDRFPSEARTARVPIAGARFFCRNGSQPASFDPIPIKKLNKSEQLKLLKS